MTAAIGYYKAAQTRFVSGPTGRIKSKVTRRLTSRVDAGVPETLRTTLSGAGTVGQSWSLSRRLGNTPSGVLRGLSDSGQAQLREYYQRIRGSGGDGDDSGLEPLTDGGEDRFVDTLEDLEEGGQTAAILQRQLDDEDFGAVFNAELPDETRAALLRASDDGDLSASETATVARKLDEPGNGGVLRAVGDLDETEQRRAFELIGETGDDGVELIEDLDDQQTVEKLFRVDETDALTGSTVEWSQWRASVAAFNAEPDVDAEEITDLVEDSYEVAQRNDVTRNVESLYESVANWDGDSPSQFRQSINEISRTRAYADGESEFVDNAAVSEVEVEYDAQSSSKDVDLRVEYENRDAEYIELKRISLTESNWLENVFTINNNAQEKFAQIGTPKDRNIVEVTSKSDFTRSEASSVVKQTLDNNIELGIYPDELSFGTVRVQTPSGDAYEFDVSDIQADS